MKGGEGGDRSLLNINGCYVTSKMTCTDTHRVRRGDPLCPASMKRLGGGGGENGWSEPPGRGGVGRRRRWRYVWGVEYGEQ